MSTVHPTRRRAPPSWASYIIRIAAATGNSWSQDRCMSMAAALAFYAAFSLAPLLVVVVAVGGIFLVNGQLKVASTPNSNP